MRKQLINWLLEDVTPEIRRTRDPEGSLLKFANDRNLSTGQLEAMGQLFNTARTISYLDKKASRGDSFALLDVPTMLGKFLEVDNKAATTQTNDWDTTITESNSLPDCFSGWVSPAIAEETIPVQATTNLYKRARASQSDAAAECEVARQICFDAHEDARDILKTTEKTFRNVLDYGFEQFEADVKYAHADTYNAALDKLATYLASAHLPVKRASGPGPQRLVKDVGGLMQKLYVLDDALIKIANSTALVDELAALFNSYGGQRGSSQQYGKRQEASESDSSDAPSSNSNSSLMGSSSPFLKAVDTEVMAPLGKLKDTYLAAGMKAMSGPRRNDDQILVDSRYQDTKQIAMLQDLLMSDPVLSEADPEKVVSLFNTIRTAAPSAASDINVMRVALRSAIQHDGVAPFDLKGFADTEASLQKNEFGRILTRNNTKIDPVLADTATKPYGAK